MRTWLATVLLIGCSSASTVPAPQAGPLFYEDVEPIVQAKCTACHYPGGIGGFAMDAQSAVTMSTIMAQRVRAKTMPPWPPSNLGPPLHNARILTDAEIETIGAWADHGAPLGDPAHHVERPPMIAFAPGRSADVKLMMEGTNAYVPPSGTAASDEVRCFVIDMPQGTPNVYVTAVNWVLGQPWAIHHLGGLAVDAASATKARSLYGKDGRPGYECAGGFGEGVNGTAGFSATAAGRDTGTMMPAGTGIFVPAGSSVILSVHYVMKNLQGNDMSGIEMWFAPQGDKSKLRPMVQYAWNAPSELPCPSGIPANNDNPMDPCSRAGGFGSVSSQTPDVVKKTNDFLLLKCHRTLDQHYASLNFTPSDPLHFSVPTSCEDVMPYDGILHVVHAHMHTRGSSAKIEAQKEDGTWQPLLDIPRWSWTWEGAYLLEQGFPVKAGQKLRLSCNYDNGTANQWSQATHEPGHDAPAMAPLEPPHYVVASPERGSDMCGSFLTIERSAYKGQAWPDACHEAQARYDDLCGDGLANFTSSPCTDANERTGVLLSQISDEAFRHYACTPKGPSVTVGGTCGDAMTCALACGAPSNGLSQACIDACKANVHAYGKPAPALQDSPKGDFDLGLLLACSQKKCNTKTTWQDYLACAEADCTDVLQWCYGAKQ